MVKLQKLRLEGFFGISQVEIDLNNQGLVLVTGLNGSGKTAMVVEGLYYALYGRSFEYGQVPGAKVVNWRTGYMLVEAEFEVDGCPWVVRRSRNHPVHDTGTSLFQAVGGKWEDRTLGSSSATQQKLDLLLGITAEGFSSSVVFSTDLLRFPDYPDAEKKRIIADLLHLSEADVALARIKDARQTKLQEKDILERELAGVRSQLEKLERGVETLQSVEEFPAEKTARLDTMAAKMVELKEDTAAGAARLQDSVAKHQAKADAARADADRIAETIVDLTRRQTALAGEAASAVRELESERSTLQSQHQRAKQVLAQTERGLADTTCPTCNRDWGEEHKNTLTAERDRVRDMIPQIAAAILDVSSEIEAASLPFRDETQVLTAQISSYASEKAVLIRAAAAAEADARRVGLQLQQTERAGVAAVDRLLQEAQALEAERSRTEGVLAEREDRLEHIYADIAEQTAKAESLEPDLAAVLAELDDLQILMECFGPKGARVLLLQSAIPALNSYAQEAADVIAPGISVQFLADEDTKGRVDISVDNANGARTYHGNSGGERRKVDLVVLFSLMRLSRVRMNVLVVDEAFEKLSEDAQQLIAAYLRTLSREIPTILMINHTALGLSSAVDQTWHMGGGQLVSKADYRR